MTELSETDVFQFCRDIAEQPFHECVDTGNVELDDETPLQIIVIYNELMGEMTIEMGNMEAFIDQHDDDLLEKYDVPVREKGGS